MKEEEPYTWTNRGVDLLLKRIESQDRVNKALVTEIEALQEQMSKLTIALKLMKAMNSI